MSVCVVEIVLKFKEIQMWLPGETGSLNFFFSEKKSLHGICDSI